MDVPSMVQRSGDTLIVRSVVSGNQLYFDKEKENDQPLIKGINLTQQQSSTLPSSLGCFEQQIALRDDDFVIRDSGNSRNSINQPEENENQTELKDEGLPQCKIKRNYSCNSCTFFTQNPRYFLTHLRDKHGEKIVINECKLCLYASRHYQKLVRHMKMVHGSTDGIEENGSARKRQLGRETRKRKIENQNSVIQIIPRSQPNHQQSLHMQKQQISTSPNQSRQEVQQLNLYKQNKVEDFLEDISKNRLLKCSLCEFTTLYRSQLVHHETDEHCNAKFFRCEKCSYVTHIKARFSKHVKYHSMPMIKCFTCDFRTPYKWNLDRHMKNHGGTGAFKCAACNFTADIKQSLTVHEMNHHIPPVGHAAGMTNLRKRNKVGGTDISDDVLSESGDIEHDSNSNKNISNSINTINNNNNDNNSNNDDDDNNNNKNNNINKKNHNMNFNSDNSNNNNYNNNNNNNNENNNDNNNNNNNNDNNNNNNNYNNNNSNNKNNINKNNNNNKINNIHKINKFISSSPNKNETKTKSETIHISDNENFSSDTKKMKYSYGDLPTDLSNRTVLEDSIKPAVNTKSSRPIPNLIPIQTGAPGSTSNKQINDNCPSIPDEVYNLRHIANMLFGKEIPQELLMHLPQLSPCSDSNNSSKSDETAETSSESFICPKKSENVFNKLKQRFAEDEGNAMKIENLTCSCGHTSKCLSELYIHRNLCQNVIFAIGKSHSCHSENRSNTSPINLSINSNSASTRCQYCRHRCKSSTDLINHMKNCSEIANSQNDSFDSLSDINERNERNETDEDSEKMFTENKHPMENKIFIWNDINSQDKSLDEKLDHSIAHANTPTDSNSNINAKQTDQHQSDTGSNQYCNDEKNDEISYYGVETAPGYGEVTKKITSEDDAANASLKKVYKCPHCSFWASTASRFHVHIVGHLNKKPFECSLCNYRSNWRWDITKHIRLKTIRDPSHINARVLMNDETGRRNYTKYNKYITLMKVTDEDGDPKLMKSGEMTPNQEASLSFLKDYESKNVNGIIGGGPCSVLLSMNNNSLPSVSNSLTTEEKKENIQILPSANGLIIDQYANLIPSDDNNKVPTNKRSPPDLIRPKNVNYCKINGEEEVESKNAENGLEKNKLYRCKECNYKHANRDMLVTHVKQHALSFIANTRRPLNLQKQSNNLTSPLQVKVDSTNYTSLMNDMLAIILNQQQSGNIKSDKDLVQQVQTFAALNLNLVAAAAFNNNQENHNNNISTGNSHNNIQNEHGEMDEASSIGVVTTSTITPTNNNTSISPNATASTNHLLNKKIQIVNNNQNNDDCNKSVITANTSSSLLSANTMVIGNSTTGYSNTSIIGGMISGTSCKNNNIINTHSTIEQNINHNNFSNILNHNNNNPIVGKNGGHLHNNTDQWRGPAPYRCGHCHQVSNWKHVIQRHCRLKHNGDIRIETIDRSSDRLAPIYRPLGTSFNQQPGRRSSQNLQNNQFSMQQHNRNNNETNFDGNSITNSLIIELQDLKTEQNSKNEIFTSPQIISSGSSSKSKQQLCPQCSYVSESKSQMNYHISLHKAKQYECKICGNLFNKKQQLFAHRKNLHDGPQQSIIEKNQTPLNNNNIQNNFLCNDALSSNKPESNIDSSDNEEYDDEDEGKLVIDLISIAKNSNNKSLNLIFDENRHIIFCEKCPARFLSREELYKHLKNHQTVLAENEKLLYKCDFCSFRARQEHSLLSHFSVHRQGYQDRTENLLKSSIEDNEFPRPQLEKIKDTWIVKNIALSLSEEQTLSSFIIQSNSLLKKQLENKRDSFQSDKRLDNEDSSPWNILNKSVNDTNKSLAIYFEKCSYCPFETNNTNIYKDHLKCHYAVSKIKSKYLCSYCDFSCNAEQDFKNHLKFHFNYINNNNKSVAFFTSYNNLELNLLKNENNASESNENTKSNDLVLYRSFDINIDDNIEEQKNVFDYGDNIHCENINCKNVIDIKTGQILAVESSSN